ncbi:class I SAM-dependent methyltransferase [Engelhardtia mirabilis]|uniref:Demethylrebeccamycin-D-glucose O-methyltransferase n=1 Tax=Engelhardtia mirabilis TaxID=2528011 RepID=A0A518BGF2_9BACT|nr:Demethylrebeccamycin-D-glucose O-methyltransferase [Planctomycetes bacterium Pla133]QDV00371.1 Demethylrebeccamycin-D-glucose O-methyltransferase [Planctomycetes bacterium Pla86]
MDAVTAAVREQYQRFPYPAGPPLVRQGTDARTLLATVSRARPAAGPIRALDAGCGCGVGLIGAAVLQSDVQFTGIDLCDRSLEAASHSAASRGLNNVSIEKVDLMTLDGLTVPEGGFDVIYSSGVVHHLSDPARGLAHLAGVLAPHGVLSLMVYGTKGREALYRLVRAIDALVPRDRPLEERLEVGRRLVRDMESGPLFAGPWADLAEIADVEFVDRYLNVNETSYDVDGVLELVTGAGLDFVRWTEPRDWDLREVLPPGASRDRALERPVRQQWKLVDELTWRPRLELLAARAGNAPRAPLTAGELDSAILCVSPEASFESERRFLRGASRTESCSVRVRRGEPLRLGPGPAARAVALVTETPVPFLGLDLVQALVREDFAEAEARAATLALVQAEVLYRPHPTEV